MSKSTATKTAREDAFQKNCPINERTGDGVVVGRCWMYMSDGHTCPRHGDVTAAVERYKATGKLTLEYKSPALVERKPGESIGRYIMRIKAKLEKHG